MKSTFHSVSTLARPFNIDCFQLFVVEANPMKARIDLLYIDGTGRNSDRRNSDEAFFRLLWLNPTFKSEYVTQFDHVGDQFDFDSVYFVRRVVRVVFDLAIEQGITFTLLRGSEVSLDRIVQLCSSPAHHDLSQDS